MPSHGVHDVSSGASSDRTPQRRIAVIGGGITGLAAAHRLVSQSSDVAICLLEASDRLGGIIRTEHRDGFLLELGPDSFITNKPGAIELCPELGVQAELIATDERFRRSLVLSRGRPLPVPEGFQLMVPQDLKAVLKSPVLSMRGRARLLAERFIAARRDPADESLASFACRRFGREVFERLIQPLVGGIYTADPQRLSLLATLPRFREMEATHGSLIKAGRAASRAVRATRDDDRSSSGARYGLFATFRSGLDQLPAALVQSLRASHRAEIRTQTAVTSIQRLPDNRWQVQLADDSRPQFDGVIVTLPAHRAAGLLNDHDCEPLRREIAAIEYASSAIVLTAHRLDDFTHPLDATGLVIPMIEQRRILAVSFSSRKFSGRAPDGHVLLRTFVGGAMQPELLQLDDSGLQTLVEAELRSILGLSRPPLFSEVVRYPNAMPQYHVGHLDRVDRIERQLKSFPGLALAGSAWRGVGIPDSISSGRNAADAVLDELHLSPAGATSF